VETLRRLSKKERRKVLIKAAVQVFSKENYQIARVADITKTAGVSEPVLYHHFHSKKELYLEILRKILERSVERLETEAAKGDSPKEKLDYIFHEYINMLENYRAELKVQFQAFSEIDDPDVKEVINNGYHAAFNLIAEIIEEGKEKNRFKSNLDSQQFAQFFIGNTVHINAYSLNGILDCAYPEKLYKVFLTSIIV